MPFFWGTIAKEGQLYGNQHKGSIAHVTNGKNFSYPGYSEILCGFSDPRIDSNDKVPNPNVTVLEWLNRRPGFEGRVAVTDVDQVFVNPNPRAVEGTYLFPLPEGAARVRVMFPYADQERPTSPGYAAFRPVELPPRLELPQGVIESTPLPHGAATTANRSKRSASEGRAAIASITARPSSPVTSGGLSCFTQSTK